MTLFFSIEAAYAGKALGIPSVGLLTVAGPGTIAVGLAGRGATEHDLTRALREYEPHMEAVQRLNAKYGFSMTGMESASPLGHMPCLALSEVTLVTTIEELQVPMASDLAQAYQDSCTSLEYVGALLDKEGACRAMGHKFDEGSSQDCAGAALHNTASTEADILGAVRAARAAGRPVVYVSMGTVITGDMEEVGWNGRVRGPDGIRRGLSGQELCRAAWGGAFDAFGSAAAEEGPLLVVALGPQPDALGDLKAPGNALCAASLPQVDILKAGVSLFLTHGGQNSFTEALSNGVPLVVCPGFGDQPINAQKCVDLGFGLQVPRPQPELGAEAEAASQYRAYVARALLQVHSQPAFGEAVAGVMSRLQHAGGVPRAVEVMLDAAAKKGDDSVSKTVGQGNMGGA